MAQNQNLGRGFGLGLGLNRMDRRQLRQGAAGGNLSDVLAQNQGLAGRLQSGFGRSGQYADQARGRLAGRLGVDQNQLPGAPAAPAPPNLDSGIPTPQPPAPPTGGTLADLLKQYQAPTPDAQTGLQNYLTSSLSRLQSGPPQPSYQDMFQRWMDTANTGAKQQAAQLNEAFGSQGARYGSDILNAQSQLRQKQTQDLATMADQIGTGLNQQRVSEANQLGGLGTNLANIQAGQQENAMQRLYADFIRRSQPPPLLGGAAQFASQPGFGDTVSY